MFLKDGGIQNIKRQLYKVLAGQDESLLLGESN
jgi:hypothetical protein